ncbi:Ribonuclease HII [Pediococcus damnosus]|uniref:Ribonuclease HII n=1 Tax=Pediococcus damnosus TaxID=51663 RepID=A0A0R2HTG9_9LACO|nr:ribonuclease HII [Pediococcus damnosus]AMV61536.1 Ribonuclease HII [Pediococcus damnosus]AMV62098.1 Ribonuclease HII [Pediococcus damnosus]AMV65899.1 Ribonuclease HII [Pediococcus damnosus]AMV68050.1 Ribonuclease HII [Pediococcus damnosus]AMV70235.1 Ribonuclease HII [Pediococcus damnosus]
MGKRATIKEIQLQLANVTETTDPIFKQYQADPRSGVQHLLSQNKKRLLNHQILVDQFQHRLTLERAAWQKGFNLVAGIDEVGRGCLAGPVVTAAVILPHNFNLIEVNDSKQLSKQTREKLYPLILEQAISVSIGMAGPTTIDQLNILQATRQAMKYAVLHLVVHPQQLLVDAVDIPVNIPKQRMFKGDSKSASIAAASIVAKVYRDHLMTLYDQLYPGYDFSQNVGYGTAKHLQGLKTLGVTPIHRLSFAPVNRYV